LNNQLNLLDKSTFSKTLGGKAISLYTLRNDSGSVAQITNYGGKIISLFVADKHGKYDDIVLGYSTIDDYITTPEKYFGALIGRYGNRIKNGKFSLNGQEYNVAKNNGPNHLHGGNTGFDSVVWDVTNVSGDTLDLAYLSPHLEEGYPGNLNVKVRYQLTNKNELKVEYWATTDELTLVNLTHHSYFNLNGAGSGTINDHILQINANSITPVNSSMIPTGKIEPVEGTPFDFRTPYPIGSRLDSPDEQLSYGSGYDHNFVLNERNALTDFAAKVTAPRSGRTMEVYTNEPGLQFYGSNSLDRSLVGKEGKSYQDQSALCLESQHFPDSPNQPQFPSTSLHPGDEYYSFCSYRFSIT